MSTCAAWNRDQNRHPEFCDHTARPWFWRVRIRAQMRAMKYKLEATPALATTPAAGGRPVVGPRASEKGE